MVIISERRRGGVVFWFCGVQRNVPRLGALLALTTTLAVTMPPEAHASCKVTRLAELYVQLVQNSPITYGEINGRPVRILLETGSDRSFITLAAARKLGLPVGEETFHAADRAGVKTTTLGELRLGGLQLSNYTINLNDNSISDANGIASLQLGADFFSHYTTEFDLGHGSVVLLQPQDCKPGELVYWSPRYEQIDVQPSFVVDIKVNGEQQHARLASGSVTSYISPDAAKQFGIEPKSQGTEPSEPPRGDLGPTGIGRLDTIEIAQETVRNAHLSIGEVFSKGALDGTGSEPLAPNKTIYEVRLGADFFQAHRLIVVPEQHLAVLTYNGGTVFGSPARTTAPPIPRFNLPPIPRISFASNADYYPADARRNGIEGRVEIEFGISEDGRANQESVLLADDPVLERASLGFVKAMRFDVSRYWKEGVQESTRYRIGMLFCLPPSGQTDEFPDLIPQVVIRSFPRLPGAPVKHPLSVGAAGRCARAN
jgi:TonB family protein